MTVATLRSYGPLQPQSDATMAGSSVTVRSPAPGSWRRAPGAGSAVFATYGEGARGYQTEDDRVEGYQSDGNGPAAGGAAREPTEDDTGPGSEEKEARTAANVEKPSSDVGPTEKEQENTRKRAEDTEQEAKRKPASKSRRRVRRAR